MGCIMGADHVGLTIVSTIFRYSPPWRIQIIITMEVEDNRNPHFIKAELKNP